MYARFSPEKSSLEKNLKADKFDIFLTLFIVYSAPKFDELTSLNEKIEREMRTLLLIAFFLCIIGSTYHAQALDNMRDRRFISLKGDSMATLPLDTPIVPPHEEEGSNNGFEPKKSISSSIKR
jgi:hypothetical protein